MNEHRIAGPDEERSTASAALPAWCPSWAEELGDAYLSGSSNSFLLHGNVRDAVARQASPSDLETGWGTLPDFLAREVFGRWDVVLAYDVGRGLRPLAGDGSERLRTMVQWLTERLGAAVSWPRDPDAAIEAIDRLLERNLVEPEDRRRRIAIVLDYAQYLVPANGGDSRGTASRLVRLLSWAESPLLRRVNVAVVLVAETLAEVHPRLVASPAVTTIDVPLPDERQRHSFAVAVATAAGMSEADQSPVLRAASLSAGLSLESLRSLIVRSAREGEPADGPRFAALKKDLIERSCQGLVELIQPGRTLDAVAGHAAAKQRLVEDAAAVRQGDLDLAPMGYLVCGPVGTGKSFIAECYAGSVGIPCVVLRNFRSKYVGETEGNLEHALDVLRSLGPVVVIIDEADAALGSRQAAGDSGTSARVFSMIARQMGDTRYRGRIIWMLLTSRPDLLPVDLKRQGRAEVHLPLFYPQDQTEVDAMFLAMAAKARLRLADGLPGSIDLTLGLSGADIESIVLAGKRRLYARGAASEPRPMLTEADLRPAIEEFLPSAQGLEKELQEIAAVLECTERRFLPSRWQKTLAEPDGRRRLQERFALLRGNVER